MGKKETAVASAATVPLPIRISVELRDRLRKVAQEEDRSVGWLIRKAVEEFLSRRK
jgi:predicted transcriptional regulator